MDRRRGRRVRHRRRPHRPARPRHHRGIRRGRPAAHLPPAFLRHPQATGRLTDAVILTAHAPRAVPGNAGSRSEGRTSLPFRATHPLPRGAHKKIPLPDGPVGLQNPDSGGDLRGCPLGRACVGQAGWSWCGRCSTP
ncbi:hypothetical protein FRAHR75_940006 [Frankia sp. Hr75.2]|nr:hypothetical protein FRAHR75_940006 [Frankia sp. Hr75.2]